MTDKAVLFGFGFTGKGPAKHLSGKALTEKIKGKQLAWAHLDGNLAETRAWLEENLNGLDPLIIDALLAENTRPRIEETGNAALIILRGVNLNNNADPEDMVSLRLWIDEHRVISVQKQGLKAIRDLCARMETHPIIQDAGDILVQLSTKLFQNMEPFVSGLSEQLDDIEENLADTPDGTLRRELGDLRKKAIIYRRYFAPQKDVMAYLRGTDLSWIDAQDKRMLLENQDRIARYVEDLDAIRERAQVIKDELSNALSERLNKNLYTLSIVTAIFLPLSFLTGLLGINVGGVPGVDLNTAFWIVCGLCGILGASQLLILKLLKWI